MEKRIIYGILVLLYSVSVAALVAALWFWSSVILVFGLFTGGLTLYVDSTISSLLDSEDEGDIKHIEE